MASDTRDQRNIPVEEPGMSLANRIKLGAGALLLLALVVFIAQNFNKEQINFLWMDWEMPLAFMMIATAVVGGIVGWLISTLGVRSARRAERELLEAARKR